MTFGEPCSCLMEGNVPRAPWVRRRRNLDSPRPAGRRWAGRLRLGGSRARQALLVRVIRRRGGVAPTDRATRLVVPVEFSDPTVLGGDPAPRTPAVPGLGTAHHPGPAAGPRTIPLLPGERTATRRVRFAVANGCTVSSLLLGMSAILLALHGEVRWAALCLVGSVIFDGLDGGLARRLGVASPFGAQLDSMADMCSFGVAAPVVVYASLHGTAPGVAVGGACALVGACAAIRLARFNVSPKDGRFFSGVPTTMTAAVLSIATLIGLPLPGLVAAGAVAVLGLAMVSSFPYAKLARIAKLPPWLWLAPIVGAFIDYRLTFAGLVALYVASGPLVWLRQRRVAVAVRR